MSCKRELRHGNPQLARCCEVLNLQLEDVGTSSVTDFKMSADLFAAFRAGDQPKPISGLEKRSSGPTTDIEENQTILVPGLTESYRSNDLIEPYQTTASPLQREAKVVTSRDPNVLFSASDDEGDSDDSFGEYEDSTRAQAVTEPAPNHSSREASTKMDVTVPVGSSSQPFMSAKPSDQPHQLLDVEDEWGDFQLSGAHPQGPTLEDRKRSVQSTSLQHAPEDEDDIDHDEWPAMEDGITPLEKRVVEDSNAVAAARPPRVASQKQRKEVSISSTTRDDMVRPTNIPPPARVLELFPLVWQQLSASNKSTVSTNSSLVDQIIQSHAVCARVLAGRSLRWKRDTHLMQSMRIGPASGGKGMKLQAVNRHELAKEDQEAAELISSWATVQRGFSDLLAKTSKPHSLALSLHLKPKPAVGQGVLKANHPCALCGLRRDERLAAVDDGSSDLFGEWWTEHWGHRDCAQFWSRYRQLL